MSDIGNVYCSYEEAEKALNEQDYLRAAVGFWWTEQYYKHGEFPVYDKRIEEMASNASRLYRTIIREHLSTPKLSKSTFVMGKQCAKQMWLHKYKYNERVVSLKQQNAFEIGHQIGMLAQRLFPDGRDASHALFSGWEDLQERTPLTVPNMPFVMKQNLWIRNTEQFVGEKERFVYEAAFAYDDVFAAVDVLQCDENGCVAYEVKSTDSIRDVYLTDASLQYYVISHCVPIKDFYIVYLNKDYLDELGAPLDELQIENCNVQKLFLRKSVLPEIMEKQEEIKDSIGKMKEVVRRNVSPKISMGEQCHEPYECGFIRYCTVTNKGH